MAQKVGRCTVCRIYEPFMQNKQRFNVLYGSAGSGKSRAAAQKVILRCLTEVEEGFVHRICIIRKYRTTLKNSVFAELKKVLYEMGLADYCQINSSDFSFRFWNGAEIYCIGLDDPEKIKSMVATSAWIEEATELEEADMKQLDLRFRGKAPYPKQIIITFNPVNEQHWLKKHFFDHDQHGWTYILHSTYKDNDFLDDQYKEILENKYKFDENMYRIYVKGEWGRIKTGGEFFFNFKHNRHVREDLEVNPKLPLHISFDFNVNPHITAIIAQIENKTVVDASGKIKDYFFVNILDEFCLKNPNNTTEALCDAIIEKYDAFMRGGIYVYGDATGKYSDTRSRISDYDIIEEIFARYMSNYSMRVPRHNPLIKIRRNFLNKVFYGSYNIEVRVSTKCRTLITDFENVLENEDGGVTKQMQRDSTSGIVSEKYAHASDCFSYFICESFKNYFDNMF